MLKSQDAVATYRACLAMNAKSMLLCLQHLSCTMSPQTAVDQMESHFTHWITTNLEQCIGKSPRRRKLPSFETDTIRESARSLHASKLALADVRNNPQGDSVLQMLREEAFRTAKASHTATLRERRKEMHEEYSLRLSQMEAKEQLRTLVAIKRSRERG